MTHVFGAAAIKQLDEATQRAGLPLEWVMNAAGRETARVILEREPNLRSALIVCGKGMNGGDGLACARWLAAAGVGTRVLLHPQSVAHSQMINPSSQMLSALGAYDVPVLELAIAALDDSPAEIVVDALLGVSFRAPLRAFEAQIIARLNALRSTRGWRVYALDLPSGLEADSPLIPGAAVESDLTVVLEGYKAAQLFSPAREHCGSLEVAALGLSPALISQHSMGELLQTSALRTLLPVRPRAAHKGTSGRVLVLGGTPRYPGAPALAALGALHSGAGLVAVVTVAGAGLGAPIEATRLELPTWHAGQLEGLHAERADALAAGMGLGQVDEDLLERLVGSPWPLLLDADALQPSLEGFLPTRSLETVLTPHPGEAARLLECDVSDIARDPFAAIKQLTERFGAVIVLKGAPTLVACRGQRTFVNTTGNMGMAAGGMGDVLSGVIAALIAQGLSAWDASRLGVYLHGAAADRMVNTKGVGFLASEVAQSLPAARLELQQALT